MRTNCYHTRDTKGVKLTGGMLHASTMAEAQESATLGLSIAFMRSGRPYFVDKEGREVSLYLSVHPEHTKKGREAMEEYQKAENARRAAARKAEEERREVLDSILSDIGEERAVKLLRNYMKERQ